MRLTSGISALCVAATLGLAGPAWSATMGLSHSGNPGWSLPPHQRGGDGGRIRPASEAISYANVEVCGCEPCAAAMGRDEASAEGRSGNRRSSSSFAAKVSSSKGFGYSGNGWAGGGSQGAPGNAALATPGESAVAQNEPAPGLHPVHEVRRLGDETVQALGEVGFDLPDEYAQALRSDGDGAGDDLPVPVPLPATLPIALLGVGFLALLGGKRRD